MLMSWQEWKYELDEANSDYDLGIINKKIYETRIRFALYKIYEEGNTKMAEGIAKAHGYDMKKLLEEFLQDNIIILVQKMDNNQ